MLPDLAVDNEGIIVAICNSDVEVLTAGTEIVLDTAKLKSARYTNNSSSPIILYVALLYSSDYRYKDTVGNYKVFFYTKATD